MYTVPLEESWLDYPSPDGNAVAVILTGCEHHCIGCHSVGLQKVKTYAEEPKKLTLRIKEFCKRACTNKIVLLGGDPLLCSNLGITRYLVDNLSSEYDICIYTGYDIEYVKKLQITGVKYFKCGKYLKEFSRDSQKTDSSFILASSNQDFYDGNYNKLSNNGILNFKNSEE